MTEDRNRDIGITNETLLDRIAAAESRLYDKLTGLDLESSSLSEYNRRYLASYLSRGGLQAHGRLLFLSLKNSQIPPEDFVLVDYGGGSGLFSFLAAEMGIGTVVYNDIYDVSCADVGRLSGILGLTPNHIVCGDLDALISYVDKRAIAVNAIVSNDVLEHIYDVESHFGRLRCLSDGGLRIVYASSANIANPRYVRSVKKQQVEAELKNREKKWGHKERDSLRSYLDIRTDMISSYAPDLGARQVEQLARSTRGLIRRDIERCVDEFRRQGSIGYRLDHPTNTCDPETGNWCEHLMDTEWLEHVLENEGFSVEILAGRYNTHGSWPKRTVKVLLNAMLQLLGRRGMFIAPCYVVYADRVEHPMASGNA
jgi:hypothetical protein